MPKTEVAQAPAKRVVGSGQESGLGASELGLCQFRWVTPGRYFPFSSRISRAGEKTERGGFGKSCMLDKQTFSDSLP